GGWQDGQTVDLSVETRNLTADVVIAAVFGGRLDPTLHARLVTDFDTLLRGFTRHSLTPQRLRSAPLPGNRRYQEATRRVRGTMDDLIAQYREEGTSGDADLLTLLISARDPESTASALTDDELVD